MWITWYLPLLYITYLPFFYLRSVLVCQSILPWYWLIPWAWPSSVALRLGTHSIAARRSGHGCPVAYFGYSLSGPCQSTCSYDWAYLMWSCILPLHCEFSFYIFILTVLDRPYTLCLPWILPTPRSCSYWFELTWLFANCGFLCPSWVGC